MIFFEFLIRLFATFRCHMFIMYHDLGIIISGLKIIFKQTGFNCLCMYVYCLAGCRS